MSKKKTKLLREPFDRTKHVYKNDAFIEMVKDAIRFFNGTPVHPVSLPERFYGTGVYALYYTALAKQLHWRFRIFRPDS